MLLWNLKFSEDTVPTGAYFRIFARRLLQRFIGDFKTEFVMASLT